MARAQARIHKKARFVPIGSQECKHSITEHRSLKALGSVLTFFKKASQGVIRAGAGYGYSLIML
jgi:hypothetical protein